MAEKANNDFRTAFEYGESFDKAIRMRIVCSLGPSSRRQATRELDAIKSTTEVNMGAQVKHGRYLQY